MNAGAGAAAGCAPDEARLRRWRLLTVALMVAGYSGYYLCRSNLSVTMPLLAADLGRNGVGAEAARARLGLVVSLGVLAYAAGKVPSGMIADRIGGRRNFLLGMGGAIAFTLACAASGTIPFFTLAWMGNRLTQSLGWAGTVKISSRWFSFRKYGTVMAIISLSFLFGDAAARAFMAALIAEGLGWRGVFAVGAGVLAILMGLCWAWLRDSPAWIGAPEAEEDPAQTEATGERSVAARLLRNPAFWIVCGLSLGTTFLRETFNAWTPLFLTQSTGMSVARAGFGSALFPLLGGVSVLLCGWLSDRMGHGGRGWIMALGLGAAAAVMLAIGGGAAHGAPMETVLLVGLTGFLIIGPYSFLAGAVALDLGGRQAGGTASGIIDAVGYLGAVLSGLPVADLSNRFGWGGAFYVLGAVAALSCAAAAWYALRRR